MQLEGQTLLAFAAIALVLVLAISRASYWRGYAEGVQENERRWYDATESYAFVPSSFITDVSLVPGALMRAWVDGLRVDGDDDDA